MANTEARVNVSVSKSKVQVAEPFSVEVTVVAPEGTQITLPPVGTRLGEFDVVDHHDTPDVPAADADGLRLWKRQLTLESIATGSLTVPSLEVRARVDGGSQVVRSKSLPIQIVSVLEGRADPKDFRDIRSVVDLPLPQPTYSPAWLEWVGGGAVLLAFSSLAIALIARRKHWLSPAEWATQRLDALQNADVVSRGDAEAATSELSAILRDYLAAQFDITAPQQTTNELLATIEHCEFLSTDQVNRFKSSFESIDLAKFAGLHMTPAELNSEIDKARDLIKATASEIVQDAADLEVN